ncbi:hypothetical protein [Flavobacterium psychrotrophum]|uniref:hypothetical protein n=1 Tax=Flavobacterium psychrotrophum TaxID=2294119 RepID=UPI000E31CCBE|nr:hypothetical protein [Flavobacterium psychrotrophum]
MSTLLKKAMLLLLFAFSFISNAQNLKYYIEIDKKLTLTTKTDFEKSIDYKKNIDVYLESNDSKIAVLFERKRYGKLTKDEIDELRKFLKEQGNIRVTASKYIIIDYVTSVPFDDDYPLPIHYATKKAYLKKLNNTVPQQHFAIYNDHPRNEQYAVHHTRAFADKENYILKLLFTAEGDYGNVAVISPDGSFISHLGEYDGDTVLEMINKLKG